MPRGTSRNRVNSGIRTRFLDQVSVAAFRPAELLTIEVANYLALNNTFYGDADTQTGTGDNEDNQGRINGYSEVIFRNVNIAPTPGAINSVNS